MRYNKPREEKNGFATIASKAKRASAYAALALFLGATAAALPSANLRAAPAANVEKADLSRARELLGLGKKEARERIKRMSGRQASELISQVLYISAGKNPDIHHLYYLLEHLEAVKASSLAQRRLNNLLWVLAVTLALFSAFFIYVIWSQRTALASLREISDQGGERGASSSGDSIYRGE